MASGVIVTKLKYRGLYLMSDSNSTSPVASQPPATISDLEQIIAGALEGLRPAPLSENITSAFPYLLPDGLRLRV